MARTITANYLNGLTLSNSGDTPLTINPGVTIASGAQSALTDVAPGYYVITNAGTILGSAKPAGSNAGVGLVQGGAVTNRSTGLINGYGFGVSIAASGAVTNQAGGTVTGGYYGVLISGTGSVNNSGFVTGAFTGGIRLGSGGAVTNLTTNAYISGKYSGVVVSGASGTVLNNGTIQNKTLFTTQSYVFGGVILAAGGTVTNAGSIISGSHGIRIAGGTGTVVNSGLVSSARTAAGGGAINLQAGGTITNSGSVVGNFYGAEINGAGSLTNSGVLFSPRTSAGAGGVLLSGGVASNASGGVIAGKWIGMQFGVFGGAGAVGPSTFTNDGSVFASDGANGAAVWMHGPGVIINNAGGLIEGDTNGTIAGGPLNGVSAGAFGVVAYYQTTLINRGTIGGTNFAFTAADRTVPSTVLIEVAPTAAFTGAVSGQASAANAGLATLELLSGASTGTISNFGTTIASAGHLRGYINIGNVTIDNGARWSLGGTVSAGTTIGFASGGAGALTLVNARLMQGVIKGFSGTETLSLGGITDVTGVTLTSGNTLVVSESAGPGLTLRFDPGQTFNGGFTPVVTAAGTDIVSCFTAGTLIQTAERGAIPVEHLKSGDTIMTHRGEAVEVIWIGQRAIDCTAHPNPEAVQPIRINASAFGPGVPSRALRLSPDHAVYVDGVLIPVGHLVNGVTIRREPVSEVTYYHVELPAHDVILAEDLPVESYLDTGDRANFSNGGGAVRLFPDFSARVWEMAGCAPLVTTGPVLQRVREALAWRETLIETRRQSFFEKKDQKTSAR